MRQLTVGTTSGTYNHPIRKPARDLHCLDNRICSSPATSKQFLIEPRNGKHGYQVYRQNFVEVVFNHPSEYVINSYALESG